MEYLEQHMECPNLDDCGSSDGFSVYEDGHGYCFSCEGHFKKGSFEYEHDDNTNGACLNHNGASSRKEPTRMVDLPKIGKPSAIKERGISLDTSKKFGVSQKGKDGVATKHNYPYYNTEGDHVATKQRIIASKEFVWDGDVKAASLFGVGTFTNASGKYVTLCEGELDAMATYQLLGSKYPVLSIKNGAQGALKDCKQAYEWLNSFEGIYICFDNDEPGRKAARKVAELFAGKSKVVKLDRKDPCEYLIEKDFKAFTKAWWDAESYTPKDIVSGKDAWDLVSTTNVYEGFDYPWGELNRLTYGARLGEMVTITAGSGMGKTQVLREIQNHVLEKTDYKLGVMYLEEQPKDTALGFMSLNAGVPFHLPDAEYSESDKRKAFDATLGTDRVFIFDNWGSCSVDYLTSKIRYFVKACDCKVIILDHISILVSEQQNGDERKALDEFAHKLKAMTVELNICLIIVSHSKRMEGKSHEEGRETRLSDLRGTAGIGQLSNIVLGLERNGQAADMQERNTTLVRVLKNRFSGLTGPSSHLLYSRETGRMTEIIPEESDNDE